MIDQNWIYLGTALNLIGSLIYVLSVLRGKTRPNRVTWFILSFAPMIAFSSMMSQGVEFRQSLMTLTVGVSPLLILISTFFAKQPVWKIERFDLICGGLSILGLVAWLITGQGNTAIVFSILADGLAFLPTLVKAYKQPDSESPYLFIFGMINGAIALAIIQHGDFKHVAFPAYLFVADTAAVLLIYFKLGPLITKRSKQAGIQHEA